MSNLDSFDGTKLWMIFSGSGCPLAPTTRLNDIPTWIRKSILLDRAVVRT
jgi:hypothetical protein